MPKFANLPALTVATLAAADLFAVDQASGPTLKSIRGDQLLQGALVASAKKILDENSNEWATFVTTGSAVNQLTVTNAATGNAPTLTATGDDTNVPLKIDAKGTGTIGIGTVSTGVVTLGANSAVTGTLTGTSTSASALTVGRQGATNPVITIDASTASVVTGLKVKGAAAAAGLALSVTSSGAAENLTVDALGTGTITLGSVSTGAITLAQNTGVTGTLTGTSSSASALTVGRQGATNPALQVDASAGTSVTGVKIAAAATGGTTAISVISSGSNEKLSIDAKGSGTLTIGGTSTGIISLGRGSVSTAIFSGTKTSVATQNSTPTAAQLLGGYIHHTSVTGAGTATLDTAANIDAAIPGVATGDEFECLYANVGTQTVTITTNTGLTLKGTVAIPAGKNAVLYFARTAAGAWDVVIVVSA